MVDSVRLSEIERIAIIEAVHSVLTPEKVLSIRLFGSRTNLLAKGGDIDLWIELIAVPEKKLTYLHSLKIALENRLGEQKIDLHLSPPIQSLSQPAEVAFYNLVQQSMATLWPQTQP